MRGPGALFLFHKWKVDSRVSRKLENSCFYAFKSIHPFKQCQKILSAVSSAYTKHIFQMNGVSLYLGLEDIYFLLGLPVDGKPIVCGDTPPSTLCNELLGQDQPNRKGATLKLTWLMETFEHVPENIGDAQLPFYVRAYVLFIIGSLLLPDAQSLTVPILYLEFLREIDHASLDSFAWGTSVHAKLHHSLDGDGNYFRGASWILPFFFMERIVATRRGFDVEGVPNEFPLFLEWSKKLEKMTTNTHLQTNWDSIFSLVQNEEGIVWNPYDRLHISRQRIYYSRTFLFCYDIMIYHRPDLVPRQLGVNVPDDSQLTPMVDMMTKSRRGHNHHELLRVYKDYIDEWSRNRHNTCIKDEAFALPLTPYRTFGGLAPPPPTFGGLAPPPHVPLTPPVQGGCPELVPATTLPKVKNRKCNHISSSNIVDGGRIRKPNPKYDEFVRT